MNTPTKVVVATIVLSLLGVLLLLLDALIAG